MSRANPHPYGIEVTDLNETLYRLEREMNYRDREHERQVARLRAMLAVSVVVHISFLASFLGGLWP